MKLTTHIVETNIPANPYKWSAENEHDRTLLWFMGSKEACETLDAEYRAHGLANFGTPTTKDKRTAYPNGVVVARKHLSTTPCLLCGDPHNAEALNVPFGCKLSEIE